MPSQLSPVPFWTGDHTGVKSRPRGSLLLPTVSDYFERRNFPPPPYGPAETALPLTTPGPGLGTQKGHFPLRDRGTPGESGTPGDHRPAGAAAPLLPRPSAPAAPATPLPSPPALTVPLSSTPSRCPWRISMGAEALECTKVPLKTWASGGRCGEPMAAGGGAGFAVAEAAGSFHTAGYRPSVSPGAGDGFLELSPFPHPLVTFSSGSGFGGGRAGGRAAPFPRRPGRQEVTAGGREVRGVTPSLT